MERVYGCDGADIETVAESLARSLGITLYLNQSPMMGPWYSSDDPDAMWRALRATDEEGLRRLAAKAASYPNVLLCRNEAEPGYQSAEYPGLCKYVIRIQGEEVALNSLEQALLASELEVGRLQ